MKRLTLFKKKNKTEDYPPPDFYSPISDKPDIPLPVFHEEQPSGRLRYERYEPEDKSFNLDHRSPPEWTDDDLVLSPETKTPPLPDPAPKIIEVSGSNLRTEDPVEGVRWVDDGNWGDIYVYGGKHSKSGQLSDDIFYFDQGSLEASHISTTGPGPCEVSMAASVVHGSKLYVFGGQTAETKVVDRGLRILTLGRNQWKHITYKGWGQPAPYGHTLNLIGSQLYVFGGTYQIIKDWHYTDAVADDFLSFNLVGNDTCWEAIEAECQPSPRTGHTCLTSLKGIPSLVLFGGRGVEKCFNDTWVFNTVDTIWEELAVTGDVPARRHGHAACIIDPYMYVFGGQTWAGRMLDDIYAFNMESRRWIDLSNRISGPRPTPRCGHSMITVGEKILILGGEGPGGLELYEDTVVELDTSKLDFPVERRSTVSVTQTKTTDLSRTYSLHDRNSGDHESAPQSPQMTRATSERLTDKARYRPAQAGTSRVLIPPGSAHSESVPFNMMPPTPTYYNKTQKQGTLTPTRVTYRHGPMPYYYNETTDQNPRNQGLSSEIIPSPVLRPIHSNPEEARAPQTFIDIITWDDEDIDSLQQKYRVDDGQWPGDYIPRSQPDDFELLNFMRQQSTSEMALKLKLVVLDKYPHDYLSHFARGDANDDIEYQRYIDGGSNGEVHQMYYRRTNQIFARKIFRENIVTQIGPTELLKIMKRHVTLCRHGQNSNQQGSENIITTFGFGKLDIRGRLYVDTEICLCNLNDFIKSDARSIFGIEAFLDPRGDEEDLSKCLSFWRIMKDIARGVHFLHATKLIHRDIKPRNILLSKHGIWKITDFDFLVQGGSQLAFRTSSTPRTSCYRPPEMIQPGIVTQSCDIWALGCVFYELLSPEGRQLFSSDIEAMKHSVHPKQTVDVIGMLWSPAAPRCKAYIRILLSYVLDVNWRNRPTAEDVLGLLNNCGSEKVIVYLTGSGSEQLGRNTVGLEATIAFWERVEWRRYCSKCHKVAPPAEFTLTSSPTTDSLGKFQCTTQGCNGSRKYRLILEV